MTAPASERAGWRAPGHAARIAAGVVSSSILLWLYARGGPAWVLGFVVLVPWLLALNACTRWQGALLGGWLMSVGYVAAALYWFGPAVGAYTGIGAVVGTVSMLVLAPLLQPQLVVFALVRHLAGRRYGPWLRALAGASAWVACEALFPKLLGDTLGHGLHPSLVMRQAADVFGTAGLTVVLVLVAEALAMAWERRRLGLRAWLRPLGTGAVLVLALGGYGVARLSTLPVPPADDPTALRVAMVQASLTDYSGLREERGAYGAVRHILDTHYALSASALRDHGADVLLWSETVYPTTFGQPRNEVGAELDREILDFVDAMGVPLVLGTYEQGATGEYNVAAFVEPGHRVLGTYRKTHPFPFTERLPRWLDGPRVRGWLPWAGTWQAGDGARVLPLRAADGREVNVVPLICLDDVRSGLAIDGARLGAEAIIGLSNDAWFSDSPMGARLHLQVAAFRSIETRLPQLRVTTNGLSAVIDDTGQVLARTGMGDQAVLTGQLGAHAPAATLLVAWGDWVGRAGVVFLVVMAGAAVAGRWTGPGRSARLGPGEAAVFDGEVAVLPRRWRLAAALLRLLSWLGVGVLLLGVARHGLQVQSLWQLWVFAALVVLPHGLGWAIIWAHAARAHVRDGVLVLEQRHRRIEVPAGEVVSAVPWRLPLPGHGVDLRLADGSDVLEGIAVRDADVFVSALQRAGAGAVMPAVERHRWLDHALLKFVAFPLLPAAVAFRLHQIIAFGSPFGEALIHGPRAWLLGLVLWWASWALGLVLLAAVLRVMVEAGTLLARSLPRAHAMRVRVALVWLARGVYYLGVPLWLVLGLAR